MLIAIHNTTEDIQAAKDMGDPIVHTEPRLIRSNQWWLDTFHKNGFDADLDMKNNCFCVCPQKKRAWYLMHGNGGVPVAPMVPQPDAGIPAWVSKTR